MKKQLAVFAAIAFASVSLVHAQDATSQDASVIPESSGQESVEPSEGELIEEPSGVQPDIEVPAPSPTPPDYQDTPVDPTAGAVEGEENATTITVSQTFTNAQDSITVVGEVSSEDEKQKVEQALQEALPDKEINNHLTVTAGTITEPSGAELEQDDQEIEVNESEPGVEAEREFELQEQDEAESEP